MLPEDWPGQPPAAFVPNSTDATLAFEAHVTDSAGQKQDGRIDRVVTTMPVRIAVFPEGGTLVEGVANVVYVLVTRADGSPVKANLRVTGIREDLKTDDRGAASFSITPKTRENRFTIRAVDEMGGAAGRATPAPLLRRHHQRFPRPHRQGGLSRRRVDEADRAGHRLRAGFHRLHPERQGRQGPRHPAQRDH